MQPAGPHNRPPGPRGLERQEGLAWIARVDAQGGARRCFLPSHAGSSTLCHPGTTRGPSSGRTASIPAAHIPSLLSCLASLVGARIPAGPMVVGVVPGTVLMWLLLQRLSQLIEPSGGLSGSGCQQSEEDPGSHCCWPQDRSQSTGAGFLTLRQRTRL